MKFNDNKQKEIVIDGAVMHKVSKGDSIESIAKEHGTSVREINSLNRKEFLTNLKVGQMIRVK